MKTIQSVIDLILSNVQDVSIDDTVDTFKRGNPLCELKGIVTTFTATMEVIKKSAEFGANLIITHEPTFYDHRDETEWLKHNEVYQNKLKLIDEHQIVIWRFHDYWHLHKPDGIYVGVVRELEWNDYTDPDCESVFNIPKTTLKELSAFLKDKFEMQGIRIVGNPEMECSRIGLLVGACPGEDQINFVNDLNVDVLICGETIEWQTCEYIRDAVALGLNKAQIILGHVNSEEAGMKYLVEWLKPKIPEVPVIHVPAGDPFKYL